MIVQFFHRMSFQQIWTVALKWFQVDNTSWTIIKQIIPSYLFCLFNKDILKHIGLLATSPGCWKMQPFLEVRRFVSCRFMFMVGIVQADGSRWLLQFSLLFTKKKAQ